MSKLCRIGLLMIMIMILEVAYAGNMRKNAAYMCAAYFAKFRIFSCIFCPRKFRVF